MIIEMSLDQHDRFVALCVPASREYEILKNGLIIRRPKEGHFERIIEIPCEMQDAQLLLVLAQKICRVAVPAIEKAISKTTRIDH
jgi:HSP20 family molecular chaperone IbpA